MAAAGEESKRGSKQQGWRKRPQHAVWLAVQAGRLSSTLLQMTLLLQLLDYEHKIGDVGDAWAGI